MSLVNKSDVKNHISTRHRKVIHLSSPASQPDATGFSEAGSSTVPTSPPNFAEDFTAEHSASSKSPAPVDRVAGSTSTPPHTVTTSAQA
jgi:hypothetical protein